MSKGPHPGHFRAGQGLARAEFVPGVEASEGSCGHCPSDGSWQALKAQFPTSFLKFQFTIKWASLVAQMVKNPSAMRETRVGSLGQEDPLEKDMATHSSIPAWRIPWTGEPGGPQSMRSRSQTGLWGRETHPGVSVALAPGKASYWRRAGTVSQEGRHFIFISTRTCFPFGQCSPPSED